MSSLLAIFVGGGLGSLCRFGVSQMALRWWGTAFPWGTLIANVLSCIVLAIVVNEALKGDLSDFWKQLLLIGFCGGFSTFSTFSFETVELVRGGNTLFAAANVLISVVVCFAIIYLIAQKTPA